MMKTHAALAAAIGFAATPTFAQYDARPHLVVPSGGSVTIYRSVSVNPDCSSLGPETIHLLQAPQGGQVTVSQRSDYVAFPPGNPRSACNHRRLPATELVYHSYPGFSGYDRFSAESIDPTGVARTRNFLVEVR